MFLECDQHNYMNAWFTPVKNPYYAIIGEGGAFSIDQIQTAYDTAKQGGSTLKVMVVFPGERDG